MIFCRDEQKITQICSLYRDLGCVLAHVGGNLNNGSNAGLRNWNLNNSSGNTNWNIGRQTLIRIKNIASHFPHHLVEIKPKRARFSKSLNNREANKK
jgi:hypothetical protein